MDTAAVASEQVLPLRSGSVRRIGPGEVVWVGSEVRRDVEVPCEIPPDGPGSSGYSVGDEVLIWMRSPERAVVVSRLSAASTAPSDTPDEVVVEARRRLTLKVGDGSITIREDGRILIKGKDLVSQATRRNRIRGGSVEIN